MYGRALTENGKQAVDNQLAELREFFKRSCWTVELEYVDKASGKDGKNRPQLIWMLEDADKRKFDLLLFWSLDRLSREGVLATLNTCNGYRTLRRMAKLSLAVLR